MWTALLIMWVLLVCGGSIIIVVNWMSSAPCDEDDIQLFWFPQWILRNLKEEFNTAGYVILSIFSNILFAPPTILAILLLTIILLPLGVWALFKYLFRKKEN